MVHTRLNRASLALALTLAVGLSACSKNIPKTAEAKSEAAIHVQTANVTLAPMSATLRVTGTLEGIREATVQSETQGRVLSIVRSTGDRVAAGAPIVRVDDELKVVGLRQAEAGRLSAEAALEKAKLDLDRTEQLAKENAATKNQLELAQLQVKGADAQLKGAQAAESLARRQLADATVKAPIAGVVSMRYINQGEMLAPGAKVVTIVDDSRMKLKLSVGEMDVPNVHVGDKVVVTVDALHKDFIGTVTAVSGKSDIAHGYEVDVEISNGGALKSGMFARARIERPAAGEVPVVTKNAIMATAGRSQVYVLNNGMVSLRTVKLGAADSEKVEVTEGLTAGEEVVTFGQSMLHDGARATK